MEASTATSTQRYLDERVYFRLGLMNEDHSIIHLYDGEHFNTAEDAKAHGESAKFQDWMKRTNMIKGWVVVKESHRTEELDSITYKTRAK